MATKVTDPALLAELDGAKPVTDPAILAQLEGQQSDDRPWYQKLGRAADDMARIFANAATFGFADKMAGSLSGTGTEAERAATLAARDRAGSAAYAGDIGGGLATGSALSNAGLTAARFVPQGAKGLVGLGARTGAMSVDGAAMGAASALGNDTDIGQGALIGAGLGAAGNVAGEGAMKALGAVGGAFKKQPTLPTPEQLRAAKDAAYRSADEAGVILTPQVTQDARTSIIDKLTDMGYHPQLQPKVATVLDELKRVSEGNTTLKGYDTVRKIASGAYVPGDKANNKMVSNIVRALDERLGQTRPGDVLAGDEAGIQALTEARKLNSQVAKSDTIAKAMSDAELNAASSGTGGNIDNAIRQRFKAILKSESAKRGFTADEQAAMRDVVEGTPSQNAARLLGRLSPQGNGLMMMLHLAGAGASGGMTIPAAGVGAVAKTLADRATPKNVEAVQRIIAAGGKRSDAFAPPNAIERLADTKREALIRALFGGSIPAFTMAKQPE
mgnify:CR=1 FL=1